MLAPSESAPAMSALPCHLLIETETLEGDEGGVGACQPAGESAQHSLADGAPLADLGDEKRRRHEPGDPVGPVVDGPVLREAVAPGGGQA